MLLLPTPLFIFGKGSGTLALLRLQKPLFLLSVSQVLPSLAECPYYLQEFIHCEIFGFITNKTERRKRPLPLAVIEPFSG